MFTLLLASHNQDKAKELKALLSGMNIQLLTLNDFPNIAPTIEDQDTICAVSYTHLTLPTICSV